MSKEIDLLWYRIKLGDEKAFEILFKELYPFLLNFAQQLLNKLPEAEETVNDIFVKLWQNKTEIIIQGSLKSYLYQMVHNFAVNKMDHFKSNKFRPNKQSEIEEWQQISNTYSVDDTFIQEIEAAETEHIISVAVEKLPEKCKEIFKLSRYENLSYEEIAVKLNLSQSTVRVNIFRALEFLSKNIFNK
jgi:RNA polymerase sigma-70 factor (ECF subfamily)